MPFASFDVTGAELRFGKAQVEARARNLSLLGTPNEFAVTLRIGDDFGNATVRASGTLRHGHDTD